ncbi:MAG: ferritin-like domain-containing protein, partial [Terriglobales bacterium]
MTKVEAVLRSPHGRRSFLKQSSIAAGTAGMLLATPILSTRLPAQASAAAVSDVDILNFALNLEYLEAEFYTVATTGMTIEQLGIGINGTHAMGDTTGGQAVNFTDPDTAAVAKQIAADEQAHVKLVRKALGSAAVAKPAINLGALGVGFANQAQFLTLARIFEDTGVSAYAGAAPLIKSPEVLAIAARILGTEAEHTGSIRRQVIRQEIDGGGVPAVDDFDVVPDDGKEFSVNFQGLVFVRSPRQVLDIVFAKAGASSGGFFPNGVNDDNLAGLAAVPPPQEW